MIRYPYHSWSYDLAGNIKNAPFFGGEAKQPCEGFNLKDNGLAPIECEVWHDWVFINLDSNAEPFDDFVKPLKTMLGDNDVTQYEPVAIYTIHGQADMFKTAHRFTCCKSLVVGLI